MNQFGARSESELLGVHPALVAVVRRALVLCSQDFGVHDGLRTEAEQQVLVDAGASHTMNSKHLVQPDGYGHAVDLVPYVNGKMRWEWPPIYAIVAAMRDAAVAIPVGIRWGGCWQPLTAGIDPEQTVAEYISNRRSCGAKAFTDGPHFELSGAVL